MAEPALAPDKQGRKLTVRGNDSFFFPRSPANGPPPAEVQKVLAQGSSKPYPLSLLDTALAASKVLKGRTPLGLCQEAQERDDPSEVLSKCAYAASRGYEMAKGILAETYKRLPPGSAVKDPEAQLWLGLFYLLGEGGMTKSCAEAQKWLAKAAAQGNESAKSRLSAGGGPPCSDATVKMSVAERLSSPDPATQAQAGAELAALPDARKAKLAESLIASLPGSAAVLNALGKAALPALEKALESKNPDARAVAANMLYLDEHNSGRNDRRVPRWTRMLASDESPDARAVAASALMLQWSKQTLVLRDEAREKPYQPMAPEVYAAFEHALLKDSDADVRKQAARSLFGAGRDAEPILAAAISDPDRDVRFISINALSYLGPQAAKAVPELVKAVKDPQEKVRKAAANALAEIAPTVPGAKAEETGLEGAFYLKDYQTPPEVEVSFEDKAGNLYTFTALEGTVTIYTEPGLEPKVRKAVEKNGGKLVDAHTQGRALLVCGGSQAHRRLHQGAVQVRFHRRRLSHLRSGASILGGEAEAMIWARRGDRSGLVSATRHPWKYTMTAMAAIAP